MAGYPLRASGVGAVLLAALLAACGKPPAAAEPLLFPALHARQDRIDTLRFTAAGNAPVVTLEKNAGVWRVGERDGWPADAGKVGQYLLALSQARLIEAKTDDPKQYWRLGVEPVSDAQAQGVWLELGGGGEPLRAIIGKQNHNLGGSYLRIDGQSRAWLSSLPLSPDRDVTAWLDRSLIDLPLARIAQVRVEPSAGKAFVLVHRGDRFRLDDAPAAAMGESHQGDALAGVLDQLKFDDLARDDGSVKPERVLRFTGVDGLVIEIAAWRVDGKVWLRLSTRIDPERSESWSRQAPGNAERIAALAQSSAAWNQRFEGHRFLLPAYQAAILMLSHEQILTGAP